jgi:hypothetical protein
MTIEIAQSTHYILTSAVSAIRAQYAGVQAAINGETLTTPYACPDLLPECVAGTAWPNPPGGGSSWVGCMVMTQEEQPALALTVSRTVYQLRTICGVRSSDLRTTSVPPIVVDDPDLTGQDYGWHTGSLMGSCVATVLVRHLTDYTGIYSAVLTGMTALPGDPLAGNDTFGYQVDIDVHLMTYSAALTV